MRRKGRLTKSSPQRRRTRSTLVDASLMEMDSPFALLRSLMKAQAQDQQSFPSLQDPDGDDACEDFSF
jgi:hypothetical protein